MVEKVLLPHLISKLLLKIDTPRRTEESETLQTLKLQRATNLMSKSVT